MRVLLITDTHRKAGGAEKHFFQLKDELKKKGIEVFSLGFSDRDEEGADFKTIRGSKSAAVRQFWRLFFNPAKYLQLRNYIKKINPDIIHIHNINKYTISLLKAVKGYPVIQTVHDYGIVDPSMWGIHRDLSPCPTGFIFKTCFFKHKRFSWPVYLSQIFFFYRRNRLLMRRVSKFISPSPLLKKHMENIGFKNIVLIPLFLDVSNNSANFEKIKKNHLLYAGQLEENKGVHLILDAIKDIPEAKLVIAGTGSWEMKLKQMAKNLGISNRVKFLGWVNNLEKLYEESEIVLVPSIVMEQFGLVTADAMMHYRPIIGSNRGGTPWLVKSGETGLIFDPLKKDDLKNKINFLLGKPELARKYGTAGRKRIIKITDKKKNINEIIRQYKLMTKN